MSRPTGSRAWLLHLARDVVAASAEGPPAPLADEAAYERWLAAQLTARGFDAGLPTDALHGVRPAADAVAFDAFALLNGATHAMQLALAALRAGGEDDAEALPLRVLICLAHAEGDPRLVGAAHAVLDHREPGGRAAQRALTAFAAALGEAVAAEALPAGHPLLGHPFHQLLRYTWAQRVGRVARLVASSHGALGGRPEPSAVMAAHGRADSARHLTVSACIGLACADGIVDAEERKLIQALMHAARFDHGTQQMHAAEFDDPPGPEAVAARIEEPALRAFVLRTLFLAALVNGRFHEAERAWLDRLGRAFELPPDVLDRCEVEALAAYERDTGLLDKLSLRAAAGRMRADLAQRIERAVKKNAHALAAEIRETSELGQLLLKAGREPLSAAERAQVKAQLTDLAKAMPALALFAVPGGSILLPLLIRHLPFDILPSNFRDD